MAIERTLSIIKPDATRRNLTGQINARLEAAGLRIVAQRRMRLSRAQAEAFYAVHRERPFYRSLCEFMTSGPVVVQVLEGENAIETNREVMGATDPAKAARGHDPQGFRRIDRSELRARQRRCGYRRARDCLLFRRDRPGRMSGRGGHADQRLAARLRRPGYDPDRTLPARAARSDPSGARGVPCDQACHPLPCRARAGLRRRSG